LNRLPLSPRFDVGGTDHLAPLFSLISDELAEVGGRAREYDAAEVGNEACPERRISETRIDSAVYRPRNNRR